MGAAHARREHERRDPVAGRVAGGVGHGRLASQRRIYAGARNKRAHHQNNAQASGGA